MQRWKRKKLFDTLSVPEILGRQEDGLFPQLNHCIAASAGIDNCQKITFMNRKIYIILLLYQMDNDAIALIDEGNYEEAYEQLIALDGYRDSSERADEVHFKYKVETVKKAEIGDYISFGAYDQDMNASNGKEDIDWLVLAKKENRILVISKYVLDYQVYHEIIEDVNWKSCSLRKWLNNEFMDAAFSDREKAIIPAVKIKSEKVNIESQSDYINTLFGEMEIVRIPGKATKDRVFLLSLAEAEEFFSSNIERGSKIYPALGTKACLWLLRSPGWGQKCVARVDSDGNIDEYGNTVDKIGGIRPALWIDWSSEE